MQKSGPKNKELELDKEHERLLEEARKQPGIREAEELFRASQSLRQKMPQLLMSSGATRTMTSTDISRPDPLARS